MQMWASVQSPLPAHASAGVQLRRASDDRQVNLQFESQPSPSTVLPSSHSSPAATMASPHFEATHWLAWQIMPVPQLSPSAAAPFEHRSGRAVVPLLLLSPQPATNAAASTTMNALVRIPVLLGYRRMSLRPVRG